MNNFHMREGKVEFRWKRWRNKKRQEVSSCLMVLFSGMVLLGAGGVALAGPTGGQVTGGTGTITQNGGTTNIDQTSNVLNINWTDFSIGQTETVNFNQPDSNSLAINRVIGGVPSQLAGALNANGRVFILNSAGITFTGTSHVNVGALLATTAMTVNGDPTKAASYSGGTGYGAVINQGSIQVSNGGFAILAAPYVQNTGFIKADLGTIALAGTNQFTLDLSGTGLINFVVPAGTVEQIVSDGKALGVDNSGTLQARSGQLIISANVATQVINAAVNLNGVIDADAFAPNGAGGSVLVTGAGDINIGGQVTARGDGAGAGGQIITKAGGADAIEALAFVSAAGGTAGGKGGLIEVSGKQGVGLAGNIDPGKGGSVLIDPNNITIISGTAGSLIGTHIGSDFIENQLRHGINVTLDASGLGGGGNVTFQPLADDHKMVGGSGNLSILADNNILVQGTNDAIVQGSGFIHLTANHGNIGSLGHALSLVTGVGTTSAGQGVSQAGDIVLKAAEGDITVKNVTIKSSGGSTFHALFSASAGHNFAATGDINVQALAHGASFEQASASVNIFAHNNISLRNVTVLASARQTSNATNEDANAQANLQLNAQGGNILANGNVAVAAFASDQGTGIASANAELNLFANNDITVNGNVSLLATAKTGSEGEQASANANLQIDASHGNVVVNHDVIVHAVASSDGTGEATGNVIANIFANNNITINGNVDLLAVGNNPNTQATSATACINLQLDASHGALRVNHNIIAHATAFSGGGNDAEADVRANLFANTDVDIGGSINLGAHARQSGSSGASASAQANLLVDANTGHVNINGDVVVDVTALESGFNSARANAKVNIFANTDVTINGNVNAFASANENGTDGTEGLACANVLLDAVKGHVFVGGNLEAHAIAHDKASDTSDGSARANAKLNVLANTDITVGGNVDVTANAEQTGSSDIDSSARANANVLMNAAAGHVNIGGDLIVDAFARRTGTGTSDATANALANIVANTDITINGNVSVTASAETTGSDGTGVNALANLQLDALTGHITVNHDVIVQATAHSSGISTAHANAIGNLLANTDITVNGNVDVIANASEATDGSTANAFANLLMNAITGNVTVNHEIMVTAFAHSAGHSDATASATANIVANNNITIGSIDIEASAQNPSDTGEGAVANANLQVDALTGHISVTNNITVKAVATASSFDEAVANAAANLLANTDITIGGNVNVFASADQNGVNGSDATASANVLMNAVTGHVNIGGNVEAHAIALDNGSDTSDASAQACAEVNVLANTNIDIGGNIEVTANAQQTGSNDQCGFAIATAHVQLDVNTGHVNVAGTVGAHAFAKASGSSGTSVNASANALVNIVANTDIHLGGADVTATANQRGASDSHSNALANADLELDAVHGAVSVTNDLIASAIAQDHGSSNGTANALINVFANTDIDVNGNVAVRASVDNFGSSVNGGNALANLQLDARSGHITVNHSVSVKATVESTGKGTASANAVANLFANTDVTVNGNVEVTANADFDNSGEGTALACANLVIDAVHGNITVNHDVIVKATADSSGTSDATANAVANIQANQNITLGSVDIEASASNTNSSGEGANARANLFINAVTGHVTVTNGILVKAVASASGTEAADANAQANIVANTDINIGGINVFASANQGDADGTEALACANLLLDALTGHVNVTGNVEAHAIAHDNGTSTSDASAHANAQVNVLANTDITIGGNVDVTANAEQTGSSDTSDSSAIANANVLLNAVTGHVNIGGDLIVNAFAEQTGTSDALANAQANVVANTDITINGNVSVTASAETTGSSATGAQAIANLQLNAITGHITVNHSVIVGATAESSGTGVPSANAVANLTANTDITVNGNVQVTANADFDNSTSGTALANANLVMDAVHGNITVNHDVIVKATADSSGTSDATANAVANIQANQNITLGSVDIEASASNTNSSGEGANARANLFLNAVTGHVTVTNGILVKALASASGTEGAHADAEANIVANTDINIGGVNVFASANQGGVNGTAANATANLQLDALTGHVSITHNLEAHAVARDNATSTFSAEANANAQANVLANTDISLGNAYVTANAQQTGTDDSNSTAKANANLLLHAVTGHVTASEDVIVTAFARQTGNDNASANAVANITANTFITIGENASVNASADNSGFVTSYASANANLLLHAITGNVTVGHDVIVEAFAHSSGEGHALAYAQANITANANIVVGGNVNVTASANQFGTSGDYASANANLLMDAVTGFINVTHDVGVHALAHASGDTTAFANAQGNLFGNTFVNVGGNVAATASASLSHRQGNNDQAIADLLVVASHNDIHINGNVIASANAFNKGTESALANAQINLAATLGDVIVGQNVIGNAHATASSNSACNGARAQASIEVVAFNNIHLGGVLGHVIATSNDTGFANALANVDLVAVHKNSIIAGNVLVTANALGNHSGEHGSGALANVHFVDSANVRLSISGSVHASAFANDRDSDNHANALASAILHGNGASSSAVHLGHTVNVHANALDLNGHGLTLADAELLVQASNGSIRLHSFEVTATANEQAGSQNAHANATANAFINAARVVNIFGSNGMVTAISRDGTDANANAQLLITGNVVLIGVDGADSDFQHGSVGASANAHADDQNGAAHALANVEIDADFGDVIIHDNLVGLAEASFDGSNEISRTNATANVHVNAEHNIFVEDVTVRANAQNFGNHQVQALAYLTLNAHNSIQLDGEVVVNALAFDHNTNATGAPAVLASANAHFNGQQILTDLNDTSNSIDVHANAHDAGKGGVVANALINFGAATLVDVGGITLDATATGHGTIGSGVTADAILVQNNVAVNWIIEDHGINVTAIASSFGTGFAHANAELLIDNQTLIDINGPVTVNAKAHAGSNAKGGAIANAQLHLNASSIHINGVTEVEASASNFGTNSHANALACASIIGHRGTTGAVRLNDILVEAFAFDSSVHGRQTLANAQLLIKDTAAGGGLQLHNVTVLASANQQSGTGSANALALANADLEAGQFVNATGGIAVLAFAQDPHGTNATASANLLINAPFVHVGTGHREFDIPGSTGTVATASANYGILVAAAALYSGSDTAAGHGAHALANAVVNAACDINVDGGIDVAAIALDFGGHSANANAHLVLNASESIHIGGGQLNFAIPGSASIGVNAGIFVGAFALNSGEDGSVNAHANAQMDVFARNNVTVDHGIFDIAGAIDVNGNSAIATANAQIQASNHVNIGAGSLSFNLSQQAASSINSGFGGVIGALLPSSAHSGTQHANVAVFGAALAIDGGSSAGDHAEAIAHVNIDPAIVQINGPVVDIAVAFDQAGSHAWANANLDIHGSQVHIGTAFGTNSDVFVLALAVESGEGSANALACVQIHGTAFSTDAVTLHNIDVEAVAFDSGEDGANVLANAQLLISAPDGRVTVDHVSMFASAFESTGHDSANVIAQANGSIFGTEVTVDGGVHVNAIASGNRQDVQANAFFAIQANYAVDIDGNIEIDALANGGSDAFGNTWAIAALQVDVDSGSVAIDGNIHLDANAQHADSEGGAGALASGSIEGSSGVRINGDVSVTAELQTNGVDFTSTTFSIGDEGPKTIYPYYDIAHFEIDASDGDVTMNGAVQVIANAEFDHSTVGAPLVGASANAIIESSSGNVTVVGPVFVQANARAAADDSANVYASANVFIGVDGKGGFGNVDVHDVTVVATASANGSHSGLGAGAYANIEIGAGESGGDVRAGFLNAQAEAIYLGSVGKVASASVNIDVFADSGNVAIRGARVFADGDVFGTGSGNANAVASIDLTAAHNINVGSAGLFADADAFAANGDHATANALISVEAGSSGVGGIFINGNVVSVAVAVGGGTSNNAHANVHLNAASTGTFGNVTVIGNIGAFAFADPQADHANASVEIFAHNNILIIGNDPIASARIGQFGSVIAFRQAHFSTEFTAFGPGGEGTAFADIDIRAGGQVVVVPVSSLTNIDKLFALPTDTPTLDSNGLTIIPLTIDGQDCGVFGQAGADSDEIKKRMACHKSPINVSDLTGETP